MALIISDPEAEELAEALAALTGECKTEAVKIALQDRLALVRRGGHRGQASVEELLAIAVRTASCVNRPSVDHATFLYDERGLPK
jgi:antitoxin VapB